MYPLHPRTVQQPTITSEHSGPTVEREPQEEDTDVLIDLKGAETYKMTAIAVADAYDDLASPAAALESSPFLRRQSYGSDGEAHEGLVSQGQPSVDPNIKRKVCYLLYAVAFTVMFGENVQTAARMQIYEDAVCYDYYTFRDGRFDTSPVNDGLSSEARCKIKPVQDELALLQGLQLLFSVIPMVLCSVPYAMLAERPRFGRKGVEILSLLGALLMEAAIYLICYRVDIFPVRLVWFTGLVTFIGGGNSVLASIIHVMIADVTPEAERTQVFLLIHASNVVSGLLSPVVSAALMDAGHVWGVVIMGMLIILIGTVVILPMVPETLHLRPKAKEAGLARSPSSSSLLGGDVKPASGAMDQIRDAVGPLLRVLTTNRQALLLVAVHTPLLFAREAFGMIGLIYVGKKFGVSFSHANALLLVFQALQGLLVFAVIPAFAFIVHSPRVGLCWSAWRRDRVMAVAGTASFALGHLVFGWAPGLAFTVLGLVGIGLAGGTSSAVLSLIGSAIRPEEVSTVFSFTLLMAVMAANTLAPVGSALFSLGMTLGWGWIGLPFLCLGVLMAGCSVGTLFIRKEKPQLEAAIDDAPTQ